LKEKLVYVKKHENNEEVIIAICDKELIGKRLIDKEKNIIFYVDPSFYQGELMDIEVAVKELKTATIANLVGNNIVEAAIKEGLVLKETVIEIEGVKHAQIVVLR